jgi:TetR/AcrR family transcriptional regulator, cholesterol catabolism regulator
MIGQMSRKTTMTSNIATSGSAPKSARTRERILDAAAAVLGRKGHGETRLSDIAEEAGLQTPALYYYFSSREELIAEVMTVGVRRVRRHLVDMLKDLPDGAGPMDRILTAVAAHLEVVLELSDYAKAVMRNHAQLPPELGLRRTTEAAEYRADWLRLLSDAQLEGELRPGIEPRLAYGLVIGALNWTAEWWNPERDSLEEVVHTAQSIVLHGLSSRSTLIP